MGQELYELPEGWEWRPLGEVASLINGRAYKKHELLNAGSVPVLRVGNFFSNRSWYYSDLELPQQKYCDEGDLLYAWSASFGPKIWEGPRAIFHYHIWKIITSNFIDKHYLYWLLELDSVDIKSQGNGVGMKHATKGGMEKRQIPLPPLNEQKRIVAKLDALFTRIDTAITHLQQTLELSKALFASALDEVMQSNSEDWKKTTIREISTKVSTGPFGSMLHKSDYISNGIPLVNPVNIIKGKIVPDHKKNVTEEMKSRLQSYVISAGDIVLARRGEIGRCAVVTDSESGWICGTGCFFLTPKRNVTPDFLANLIRSSTYKKNLEDVATGATIKNISNRLLSDFSFSLPSLDEQNRIVAHLDALSERTRTLEATTQEKINDLTALKASLLDAAFKGELQ